MNSETNGKKERTAKGERLCSPVLIFGKLLLLIRLCGWNDIGNQLIKAELRKRVMGHRQEAKRRIRVTCTFCQIRKRQKPGINALIIDLILAPLLLFTVIVVVSSCHLCKSHSVKKSRYSSCHSYLGSIFFVYLILPKCTKPTRLSPQQSHDMAEPRSSATALEGHSIEVATSSPKPDLSGLLSTYILATNLSESELHEFEDILVARGAPLTYDIKAANLVIGNISKERRARFELKRGNVPFEDDEESSASVLAGSLDPVSSRIAAKRRKLKDGTRELIEDVNIVDAGNKNNRENAETEIYSNEGNDLSKSHLHSSLVTTVCTLKLVILV